MVAGTSQQPYAPTQPRFPFDIEFQKSLLRLITEDDSFGVAAAKHLRPEHFEHEILSWVYSRIARHREQYNTVPTLGVVMQATRELEQSIRPLYSAMVDAVKQSSLRDSGWLRDQVLDFVRRNIFVRAFHEGRDLYNGGKVVDPESLLARPEVAAADITGRDVMPYEVNYVVPGKGTDADVLLKRARELGIRLMREEELYEFFGELVE